MSTGLPWLGASASRTLRGIEVRRSRSPKNFLSSPATCWARLVRSSYMVSTTPSTVRSGLKLWRTRSMVSISSLTPSRAKYSGCMGIRMESAATRALSVSRSSAGGQSRIMNSNSGRTVSSPSRRRNSRLSCETSSMLAPIRFLCAGMTKSPSGSTGSMASRALANPISTW